jgi:hypothetical protein
VCLIPAPKWDPISSKKIFLALFTPLSALYDRMWGDPSQLLRALFILRQEWIDNLIDIDACLRFRCDGLSTRRSPLRSAP